MNVKGKLAEFWAYFVYVWITATSLAKAGLYKQAFAFIRATAGEGFGSGVVGALVGIMVSLLIAIVVVMNLVSSQDQSGWSTQANATWASLTSNIWTALTLLVIVPVIVGAVIILGYVRRGM